MIFWPLLLRCHSIFDPCLEVGSGFSIRWKIAKPIPRWPYRRALPNFRVLLRSFWKNHLLEWWWDQLCCLEAGPVYHRRRYHSNVGPLRCVARNARCAQRNECFFPPPQPQRTEQRHHRCVAPRCVATLLGVAVHVARRCSQRNVNVAENRNSLKGKQKLNAI